MNEYLFNFKSIYSSFKLAGFISSTAWDVHQWDFTVMGKVKIFRSSPHFTDKPLTKSQGDQRQQFSCGFKACFVIGLLHLTRKLECVFSHVQSVFCGSFSSYQFAHGDVL